MEAKVKKYSKFHIPIETRRGLVGWVFIAPWLVGFILFSLYPLMKTLILSFSKVTSLQNMKSVFVGTVNYTKAFIVDVNFIPMFISIIRNTFLSTILIIIFSLFVAILLNDNIKARGAFRAIFFLPVILGSGYVAQQILNGVYGSNVMVGTPTNLLNFLGPKIFETTMNLLAAIQGAFWKSSVQIVLFLSGLQGISDRLYESAKVDGATAWESFWKITLPMVAPVTLINIIYTVIDSFTDINNSIMSYIYDTAFTNMDFGFAAAMGMMYFLFVLVIVIGIYAIVSRRIFYAGER